MNRNANSNDMKRHAWPTAPNIQYSNPDIGGICQKTLKKEYLASNLTDVVA